MPKTIPAATTTTTNVKICSSFFGKCSLICDMLSAVQIRYSPPWLCQKIQTLACNICCSAVQIQERFLKIHLFWWIQASLIWAIELTLYLVSLIELAAFCNPPSIKSKMLTDHVMLWPDNVYREKSELQSFLVCQFALLFPKLTQLYGGLNCIYVPEAQNLSFLHQLGRSNHFQF